MRSEFIRVICTHWCAVSLRAHIYCIFVVIKNIVHSATQWKTWPSVTIDGHLENENGIFQRMQTKRKKQRKKPLLYESPTTIKKTACAKAKRKPKNTKSSIVQMKNDSMFFTLQCLFYYICINLHV